MLSIRPPRAGAVYPLTLGLMVCTTACTVVQNFGGTGPSPASGGSASGGSASGGSASGGSASGGSSLLPGDGGPNTPGSARSWQWLNPSQGGAALRAVWASSSQDVWYVGEQGTVIHWDGVQATKPYVGAADETFYTVWSSGPSDVWIAGDHGPDTANVVLHWDGTTWSEDFSLALQRVHSLWGIDESHVFAMTNPWSAVSPNLHGEVWWWNGHKWALWGSTAPDLPAGCGTCQVTGCYGTCVYDAQAGQAAIDGQNPPLLRDAWGSDADHVWVVGNAGTLALLSADDPSGLTHPPAAPGSPVDPFDPNIDYVGVWGSAADDVWAIYALHKQPSTITNTALGLAHWDGHGWWAESNTYSRGIIYDYMTGVVPDAPLRQGHQLFGLGPSTVVQTAGQLYDQADNLYNGTFAWYSADKVGPRNWGLAGDGQGHLYAAGALGGALVWQPSAVGQPWTGLWDKGAAMDLYSIAPIGEDEAYAVGGPTTLAHWTGVGWTPVQVDPFKKPNGSTPQLGFKAVAASSASDIWAVGFGVAAHFDGTTWSAMPVLTRDSFEPYLTSVWVDSPSDAWAVGCTSNPNPSWAFVFHWDGVTWNHLLSVPAPDAYYGNPGVSALLSVFGLSASDVWIVGYGGVAGQLVLHWDGKELKPVSGFPSFASQIWGSGGPDLWVAPAPNLSTRPSPLFHFDGTSWVGLAANADAPVLALSGTGPSDVWMIDRDSQAALLRSWDGHAFRTALSSPLPLTALGRGPDGQLWAVGQSGATLRLPAPSAASAR